MKDDQLDCSAALAIEGGAARQALLHGDVKVCIWHHHSQVLGIK